MYKIKGVLMSTNRNLELEVVVRAKCIELSKNLQVPEEQLENIEVKLAYMSNVVVGGLFKEGNNVTELAIVVSLKNENGNQPIFNTLIIVDDNAFESVENAFPSKEEIENELAAQQQQQMMGDQTGMPTQEQIQEALAKMEANPIDD